MNSFVGRRATSVTLGLGLATLAWAAGCDSSMSAEDAGAQVDASVDVDGGADAGAPDSGGADAGVGDAGPPPDAGPPDAGPPACPLDVRGSLSLPTDEVTDTLRGESLNTTTSCTPDRGTQGPEHFYRLHVEARTGVVLRSTSTSDTVLAIRTACDDPVSELACNNDGVPFEPGDAELRAVLDPGDYYVLVDVHAFGIGGDYTLSLGTFEPPPNARCEDATPVADGTVLMGVDPTDSVPTRVDCGATHPPLEGTAVYYRATVPADHRLLVEASSTGAPVEIRLLDGCASPTCIGDPARAAMGPAMSWVNDGADTDVVIGVAVPSTVPPGPDPITFDLAVSIEPLPAHADCAMARTVADGSVETGDTSLGDPSPTSCPPEPMELLGIHYYTATVPAGHALRATARPTGPFFSDLGVVLLDGCAGSCLESTLEMPAAEPSAIYRNTTAAPVDVVAAVGNVDFAAGGPFEATFSIVPLPTNVSCTAPLAVADGSMISGDTALGGTDTVPCGRSIEGAVYYSATIPPGHTLGVDVTSADPVEAAILDGCGGACLGTSTRTPMGTLVTQTNSGSTDLPVIIAVGRGPFAPGGPFTMRVALAPAPMNVACGSATTVVDGTSLTLQDARAAADDLSSVCEPLATGGALYYRATVPPGETLRAAVTPLEGWRPAVRLLPSCGASSCLASGVGVGGPTAAASWTNDGASDADVIIAAGAHDSRFTGYFRLDVSIGPAAYTESSIPSSCDDVSAGTVVAGVVGDDAASATMTLPFTVPFFGGSMSSFAVTTNGIVQLFSDPRGRASTAFSNEPIPSPAEPNGMVAALWDDLIGPSTSAVRTHVLGAAPDRRLVVEWSGYDFISRGSSLTFQAKLFESGVVELHYCAVTSTDAARASGGSATVGLEDPLGADGAQHSFDTVGSVSTTDAIRFTPAP